MPSPASVPSYERIAIIINPVAGLKEEAEQIIRAHLATWSAIEVSYHFTEKQDDATHFAREAAASGVQAVLAYGGDGTMTEVAEGLRDSEVPLGILPGGTANVMAVELGIPIALEKALDLILNQPTQVRQIDMGRIDNQSFLLRAGIGYEAQFSATAPRAAKRKRGRLAYLQHALNLLGRLRQARYIITIDGETHVTYGITCLICNSTNIGLGNLQLVHESSISDGLLDVVVIEGMGLRSMGRVVVGILQGILPGGRRAPSTTRHWQAQQVKVAIRPRQLVAYDGEKLRQARQVSAHILPGAVRVIVPAPAN